MKNRILKKSGVIGMVCLLGMMTVGSVSAYGTVSYTAENGTEDGADAEIFYVPDTSELSDGGEIPVDEYEGTGEVFESTDAGSMENAEDVGRWEDTDGEFSEAIANEIEQSGMMESESTAEQKKTDLQLAVSADSPSIKAGSDLVYSVSLENTGEIPLKNIRLNYNFDLDSLTGEWSAENETDSGNGTDSVGNTVIIDKMDIGMRKQLYLTLRVPQEQESAITLKVSAEAQTDDAEQISLVREAQTETEVIPLKASFEVTKTADRTVALPGDKIMFQICIRNTGERTLHSVVTTERFKTGNIPVEFVEKEGVILNNTKTKARIEKIEPGMAAGLQAVVTLPDDITSQELLNEVTVTTKETGEQVLTSQAKIQVEAAKEKSEDQGSTEMPDTDSGAAVHSGESHPVSTNPKTGDPYQPFLWLAMIPGSMIAAGWIRSRI